MYVDDKDHIPENNIIKTGLIYSIKNTSNGKVYIGQTVRYAARKYSHLLCLRKNAHYNKHLQNDYNKHGEDKFLFAIIKKDIPIHELNDEENYFIGLSNFGDRSKCYNLSRYAEMNRNKIRAKHYAFIDPCGNVYSGFNICVFAAQKNLNEKSLQALARGKIKSYFKWRSVNSLPRKTKLKVAKENKVLVDPDDRVHTIETTLIEFANNFNLSARQLSYLVNEEIKSYKGWRLQKFKNHTAPMVKYRNGDLFIKHSNTNEIFGPIKNPKEFCEAKGISSLSSFYKMLNGKRKSCEGYVKFVKE